MYAITSLLCVALLLFGQTDAFSCKAGISGLASTVQCQSGQHKCAVTVTGGLKTFGGCVPENSPLCGSNMACCCSTDGCNTDAFLKNCDGSSSAGYSIKLNMFILFGLLLLAYKLAWEPYLRLTWNNRFLKDWRRDLHWKKWYILWTKLYGIFDIVV